MTSVRTEGIIIRYARLLLLVIYGIAIAGAMVVGLLQLLGKGDYLPKTPLPFWQEQLPAQNMKTSE